MLVGVFTNIVLQVLHGMTREGIVAEPSLCALSCICHKIPNKGGFPRQMKCQMDQIQCQNLSCSPSHWLALWRSAKCDQL